MFCTRCGTRLDDNARFCTQCGAPTSAEPTSPPFETKRLRRIPQKKKIAGVCAGYAEYFNMDVTLMRLIWIGMALIPPHIGIIGYIISWIVLPKDSSEAYPQ